MPGSRLTVRDRRDIASGLGEGLGYAEIARRLRRPTSTVSREVNRNGGHNHYRADQAHRAAGHRARRRQSGRPWPSETVSVPGAAGGGVDERDREAVRGVEQRLIEMMSAAGFPRMMAMVLVCLFVSEFGSLTVTELVERLRVSPASISKAVRNLEHLEFVRRERGLQQRRERYILDEDMWSGVWSARTEAMASWGEVVREGAEVLGSATPAGARLAQWAQFLSFLHGEMVQATERWRRLVA